MCMWKLPLSHFSEGKYIKYKSKSPFIKLNLQTEPDLPGYMYSELGAKRHLSRLVYIKTTPWELRFPPKQNNKKKTYLSLNNL